MNYLCIFLFSMIFIFTGQLSQAQPQVQTYFCPPCNGSCDTVAHTSAGQCPTCGMTLVARTRNEQMEILRQEKAGKAKIAVYVHQGMEILDFAGPVEVFTVAGFEVFTVGLTKEPIISQGVVTIVPQYSLDDCPEADILVVVGGNADQASKQNKVLDWLKKHAAQDKLTYSVCTGAFFLGKAGLLDGRKATTFHSSIQYLREIAPKAEILENIKFVDSGKVVTAAGVSSGINGALYLVERLLGKKKARDVANYMEYENWTSEEGLIVAE